MSLSRALLPLAVVATVALAGCGSNGTPSNPAPSTQSETTAPSPTGTAPPGASALSCASGAADREALRVTSVDCATGRAVAAGWSREPTCKPPAGASRFACTVAGYRCLGTAAEHRIAVSCARPGRSIAFLAKRG